MPTLRLNEEEFELMLKSDDRRSGKREIRLSPPRHHRYTEILETFNTWLPKTRIACRKCKFVLGDEEIKIDSIRLVRHHITERCQPVVEYEQDEDGTIHITRSWGREREYEEEDLTPEEFYADIRKHPVTAWHEPFEIRLRCRS